MSELAIVCAKHPDVLLQIYEGYACVYAGAGPERGSMVAEWDDDEAIGRFIYELSYGKYAKGKRSLLRVGMIGKAAGPGMTMNFFSQRSKEEEDEIYALARFIGDYNMQKGSIDARYLPYVKEVAAALYDAGYRKIALPKK